MPTSSGKKPEHPKFSTARFKEWREMTGDYLDRPLPPRKYPTSASWAPNAFVVAISVLVSLVLNLFILSAPRTTLTAALGLRFYDASVWQIVEERVEEALLRYSKDTFGIRDYALVAGGAQIVSSVTSPTYNLKGNGPDLALTPGVHPGRCWQTAVHSGGHLGVALANTIVVSNVTIDHIAAELASNITTAPKDMVLWGLIEDIHAIQRFHSHFPTPIDPPTSMLPLIAKSPVLGDKISAKPVLAPLASMQYDPSHLHNVQVFPVHPEIRLLDIPTRVVVLEIKSNWGDKDSTCLYRLRVHGRLVR